jgi:hypothetical protein
MSLRDADKMLSDFGITAPKILGGVYKTESAEQGRHHALHRRDDPLGVREMVRRQQPLQEVADHGTAEDQAGDDDGAAVRIRFSQVCGPREARLRARQGQPRQVRSGGLLLTPPS